ncbi:MAG: cytochrome c3 family protein [Alphaproteobacteria bacterium]|uniref:Cytochrome c3 family protein n=1 Tax=Candidatus Nitrobium versatile TaxID=2884831 RepID=A0A953M2E5_9BACT|nr:cytochrome c3 family protein [Candidatus Nitrobium versatile]
MRGALVFIIGILLVSGVSSFAGVSKEQKAPEKVTSRDEALGSLPCFKCHSYQKFAAKPKPGVFSHQLHATTGYHCNQCHDFRGHQHIKVNKDVCGNCHGIRTITLKQTALPSRFDHEGHTKRLGCRECHPKLFLMKTGSSRMTMAEMNKGAFCGACHDGARAFSTAECMKCHDVKKYERELVYKEKRAGTVVFSHKFHTAAFSCNDCHPKLFRMQKTQGRMTMEKMEKGTFCGACHNGNIASPLTDCTKCHKS